MHGLTYIAEYIGANEKAVTGYLLQGLLYVDNFISTEEEAAILTCIQASAERPWIKASGRRIQNWGGQPGRAEAEVHMLNCLCFSCRMSSHNFPPLDNVSIVVG